jgi:proteic killer suppression protein
MYSGKEYIDRVITTVIVSKAAEKDLRKMPRHVRANFFTWLDAVSVEGLESVRRVPGYHDEPLAGTRKGQRSIRLSKGYRAIYTLEGSAAKLVRVLEVNKHEY